MAQKKNIRQKRANKKSVFVVMAVSLVICAGLLFAILNLRKENQALLLSKAALEANVDQEESRKETLTEEKGKGLTEKKIIEIAREKFGLVFPDEIIFVPEE